MFVNEEYKNYKYLVSASDNYVILTNRRSINADWQNPVEYPVIYQYFDPSYINIEATRTTSSSVVFPEVEVSQDFWDRPDCSELAVVITICVILLMFVINSITEFVQRGGIFKW